MTAPTFFPKINFSQIKSESSRSSGDAREKCGSTNIPWVSHFSPLLSSWWQSSCNEKEVATCLHFLVENSSHCPQAITFRKINSEATTLGYSTDLKPANTQVYDLETWVKLMEKERNVLEAICFLYPLNLMTIIKLLLDPTCEDSSTVTTLNEDAFPKDLNDFAGTMQDEHCSHDDTMHGHP